MRVQSTLPLSEVDADFSLCGCGEHGFGVKFTSSGPGCGVCVTERERGKRALGRGPSESRHPPPTRLRVRSTLPRSEVDADSPLSWIRRVVDRMLTERYTECRLSPKKNREARKEFRASGKEKENQPCHITLDGGSLGSQIDEERSQLCEAWRIAGLHETITG